MFGANRFNVNLLNEVHKLGRRSHLSLSVFKNPYSRNYELQDEHKRINSLIQRTVLHNLVNISIQVVLIFHVYSSRDKIVGNTKEKDYNKRARI